MTLFIEMYGWQKLLTPELLVVIAAAGLLYAKAGNIEADGHGRYKTLSLPRQAACYAGLVCMYFGYGGVLSALAASSIDYYVLQLVLRYMCMAPLLIVGLPERTRAALIARLPGGRRMASGAGHGVYAAFVFYGLLSLVLAPPVYNALADIVWLGLIVHAVLLAAALLMWEAALRSYHSAVRGSAHIRFRLLVFGSVLLFPICVVMMGSGVGAYQHPQLLADGLCLPPSADSYVFAYSVGSTSVFGGLTLMAGQQLSFAAAIAVAWKSGA